MPTSPPQPSPASTSSLVVDRLLALGAGIGVTVGILGLMAFAPQVREAAPEPEIEEIATVDLQEPPPAPPPQTIRHGAQLPPLPVVFEEAPSTSSVRIPPTPIPNLPVVTTARPAVSLQFSFTPGEFRPDSIDWGADLDHVFQPFELDQRPIVIFKKAPNIPSVLYARLKDPRMMLLFTVNINGTVENVRPLKGIDPEIDRLMIEAVGEWRFRPGLRKGRKVRSLVQLPVRIKAPSGNPFSTN